MADQQHFKPTGGNFPAGRFNFGNRVGTLSRTQTSRLRAIDPFRTNAHVLLGMKGSAHQRLVHRRVRYAKWKVHNPGPQRTAPQQDGLYVACVAFRAGIFKSEADAVLELSGKILEAQDSSHLFRVHDSVEVK